MIDLTRRSVPVRAHPGSPCTLELIVTNAGAWFGSELAATIEHPTVTTWTVDAGYSATRRRISLTAAQTAELGAGRWPYTVTVDGIPWFGGVLELTRNLTPAAGTRNVTVNITTDTATVACDVGPVAPPGVAGVRLAAAARALEYLTTDSTPSDMLDALIAVRTALGGAPCS